MVNILIYPKKATYESLVATLESTLKNLKQSDTKRII